METDCFQLGKKPKGGLGAKTLNKCYVQALAQRGGDLILEVFPNPRGGPEALRQIGPLLTKHVQKYSTFHSDAIRAAKAWIADNPDLELLHIIVNHSEAKEYGFTWYLFCDEDDGYGFEHLTNGEAMLVEGGIIFLKHFFSFFSKFYFTNVLFFKVIFFSQLHFTKS